MNDTPPAGAAAEAHWARRALAVSSMADAPVVVRRLLHSHNPSQLCWMEPDVRYLVVREVLLNGDEEARAWLRTLLRRREMRELVMRHRGAGCSEPERQKLRKELRLSLKELPRRPTMGLKWRA